MEHSNSKVHRDPELSYLFCQFDLPSFIVQFLLQFGTENAVEQLSLQMATAST